MFSKAFASGVISSVLLSSSIGVASESFGLDKACDFEVIGGGGGGGGGGEATQIRLGNQLRPRLLTQPEVLVDAGALRERSSKTRSSNSALPRNESRDCVRFAIFFKRLTNKGTREVIDVPDVTASLTRTRI